MGRIDPLSNVQVRTVRRESNSIMRVYREAIERALQEATRPHVGGRRHMGTPLSPNEIMHHARVDRFLRRRREQPLLHIEIIE